MNKMEKTLVPLFLLCALMLGACHLPGSSGSVEDVPISETATADTEAEAVAALPSDTSIPPTVTVAPSETATAIPPTETLTDTPLPTDTPTEIPTDTPTNTPVPTDTATATATLTPTVTPTYAIFRGKVIPDRANCRYGPGAAYLYKYGLVGGSNLEIIGRNELGTWVLIQAIGGDNPCWVKAELMELKGEALTLEPVDVHIVQGWSPYYPPLTNVSAVRDEDDESKVTVFWSPLVLRAGDDAEQVPYVVEGGVLDAGEIVFTPIGAYETVALVIDEPGCDEPSHGRVLAAEKHGYTAPVEIPWP